MALTLSPPTEIEAIVRATGWKLMGSLFHPGSYKLRIDLQAYHSRIIEKEELFQLLSESLGLPVVGANRNYLLFSLDSTSTKVVPVVLDNNVALAKDFFLSGEVQIEPDSITLTGPEAALAGVNAVRTAPLTATNVKRTIRKEVELLPPASEQIQMDVQKVIVTIPVEQFTELEFNIAVSVPEDFGDYVMLPKSVKLQCITKLSAARNISDNDFMVAVVESEFGKDPNSAFVPVKLVQKPDYVRGIRLSQNAVEMFLIR